ncbi:MAG: LysE family translocator [Formosimonas sp.]
MTLATYLLFIPTCLALNLVPGPNNVLSMNNATRFGFRAAFTAGSGRLLAFAGMIVLAAFGLAAVLASSAEFFFILKIVGGLYLLWIALQIWRSPVADIVLASGTTLVPTRRLASQEFICAASNPKAILIFTAVFPQFLNTSQGANTAHLLPQFLIMGVTFLVFEWLTIALYAYMGLHLRKALTSARGQRRFNRASGGLLGVVGVALLASKN